MIRDFFELAFTSIRHRRRRSWLTVVGIFIGITAVVALISLGQGLENSVQREFEQIGSDKVFINPGGDQSQGQITSGTLTDDDLEAVRNTQSVDEAAGALFSSTTARFQDDQAFLTVIGMPTGEGQSLVETSWAITLETGRSLRSTDTSNIVIGSEIADGRFEEQPGIRSRIEIDGSRFQVVGIMEPTGDPGIDAAVTMPITSARDVLEREDGTYDWIFASTQPGYTPEEAKQDIEKSLRNERGVDEGEEDFTVSTQEDLLESFENILNVVRGVVIGIASISLLVGGVGIMNTMYTSVTERTREIGVMKAIGATNRQVMTLFLIESGIIGLVGGAIGLITGVLLAVGAANLATQFTQIEINAFLGPELVAGALLFSFLVGTVSGVLPARKAAKLQPADALRYE